MQQTHNKLPKLISGIKVSTKVAQDQAATLGANPYEKSMRKRFWMATILIIFSSPAFASGGCYVNVKVGTHTFENVKKICGEPENTRNPPFFGHPGIFTYKDFYVSNTRGGKIITVIGIFDRAYKDPYGIKIGDFRQRVYKVHGLDIEQGCDNSNDSMFCNSLKHIGSKRVPEKRTTYHFNNDRVSRDCS